MTFGAVASLVLRGTRPGPTDPSLLKALQDADIALQRAQAIAYHKQLPRRDRLAINTAQSKTVSILVRLASRH